MSHVWNIKLDYKYITMYNRKNKIMKIYNFNKQYCLLSSSKNTKIFNSYRTLTTYNFNDGNFIYLIIGSLLGNSYMKKNNI